MLFLASTKRFRINRFQFENFVYETTKEEEIKKLKSMKAFNKSYKIWDRKIGIPFEYIEKERSSLSLEDWEELGNKKEIKEIVKEGNEKEIIKMIIEKHKSDTILKLIKRVGYFGTTKSKLEYQTWLLKEFSGGRINYTDLKQMYYLNTDYFKTEEEYKEQKKEELNDKAD